MSTTIDFAQMVQTANIDNPTFEDLLSQAGRLSVASILGNVEVGLACFDIVCFDMTSFSCSCTRSLVMRTRSSTSTACGRSGFSPRYLPCCRAAVVLLCCYVLPQRTPPQFQKYEDGTYRVIAPFNSAGVAATIFPMPTWSERVYREPELSPTDLVRVCPQQMHTYLCSCARTCCLQIFTILAACVLLVCAVLLCVVAYFNKVSRFAAVVLSFSCTSFIVHR